MSKRISQLSALTTVASDDYIPILDTSAGDTKKVSVSDLVGLTSAILGADGYYPSAYTFVYVSANSFKIVGVDVRNLFPVGTKIKLTQTTDKFFYVASSSFSSDTTVNIVAGTDYTLANTAITSPKYSYEATPQGFPKTFNYTPTPANVTLGTGGTVVGNFYMNGSEFVFEGVITLGTGGSMGSQPTVSFPTPSTSVVVYRPLGTVILEDVGSDAWIGIMLHASTTTAELRVAQNGNSSDVSVHPKAVNATNPFTFGNTDRIVWRGSVPLA